MSRVARKRQEKEARKKKIKSFFSKRTDDVLEKNDISNISNEDRENSIQENKVEQKIIKEAQDKIVESSALNKQINSNDLEKTIVKTSMKTADKIISVEDERMYFERKKNNKNKSDVDERVLTVGDIMTAEDEEKNIEKPIKEVSDRSSKEENINQKKRLSIEQAPFEDVVKVAESRKQAEIEKQQRKNKDEASNVNTKDDDQTNKVNTDEKNTDQVQKNKSNPEKDNKLCEVVSSKSNENNGSMEDSNLKNDNRFNENKSKEIKLKQGSANEDTKSKKATKKSVEKSKKKDDSNLEKKGMSSKEDNVEMKNEKSNGSFKKVFLIVIGILIIIYVLGCVVFSKRFLPNTTINGINASYKTPQALDKIAQDRLKGYKLTLIGRNNVKDIISGDNVDLRIDSDTGAKKIKEEQGYMLWPLAFFNEDNIKGRLNVSLNQEKLDQILKNLNIFKKENIINPVSAYPVYVEKKKDFEINKGILGSKPVEGRVNEFVKNELLSETLEAKYPDSVYAPQRNTASNPNLKKAIAEMNKYTKLKIVYVFGKEKYTLTGLDIAKMFNIDSERDYGVSLDRNKVREFVRSLSRKYSTYGDAREINSASTGGKLKVTGGSYGWLIDREKETDALMKIIQEGKDVENREPIYAQKAISRENGDLGNEFIEIDLTKQHMWFVRNGEVLVSTPIVSGNPNRGDATPPGIYPITYKQKHAVLRGPGYASPVVYWMPFNGSIGIHDASWQPVYGGKRYLYAGSHGCINTPLSKVAEIFKLSKEGMPVIVHY